jgi:cell wall-associated NlpC family hydrolase
VTRARPSYSLGGPLGQLIVRGSKLSADVAESVVAGSVSLSTAEVTELQLTIVDTGFELLRSGLFSAGTPTSRGSRCDYGRLAMEVRAIEVAPRGEDHVLTVTARSLFATMARRTKGKLKRDTSPTDYVRSSAKNLGLAVVAQPSAKRHKVGPSKGEFEWDTWQRLATELGYDCFEAAGVLYFGKPTWLIDHTLELVVAWKGARTGDHIDELPRCRRTGDDDKRLATVAAALRGPLGAKALPGQRFTLDGVPLFDGAYMVDTVTASLADNAPVAVTAVTPINPKPQPPAKHVRAPGGDTSSTPGGGTSPAPTGGKSAAAFVAVALSQLGDSYVYGAEASASDPNPSAFDCSELVQWALGRVGVPFTDYSLSQIDACQGISVEQAIGTRGALLWHPGHIAISLGNGKTVEAANPEAGVVSYGAAGRFARGGLVPSLAY